MTKVEEIHAAIEALPKEEYVQLRRWFTERDWRESDRQIEADSAAAKLDYLLEEALNAKKMEELRGL